MPPLPGPAALGRGVVLLPGASVPAACADWARLEIDDQVLDSPGKVADELHHLWLRRQPVVIVLAADPGLLREPERCDLEPWQLEPDFELTRERLQYLVWSNNYDMRTGVPIWWHARRAERLGATSDGPADVVLPDGTPAWCDGGPRQPLVVGDGATVVHREAIEAGVLVADRISSPSADVAPDQLAAVAHGAGPARIIAPAGSGKTRVLTARLRHLLADRRVTPTTVTAVAYNKRAADQLGERTTGLGAHIRTLNSLGLAIVNGNGRFATTGLGSRQVIEEVEVRRILESLVEVRRQQNTDPMAPYIDALSDIRLGLTSPRAVEEAIPDAAGVAEVFDRYRAVLTDRRLLDFDEQIYLAIETLLQSPEVRAHDQRLCRHLLVDEFQDLTPAHLLMLRLLAAPTYDVFGVGDDDQVIYSYAGASPEFLIDYGRYFPDAASYALETNYRCPPAVVDGARHLLGYNERRISKTIRSAPGRTGLPSELRVDRRPDDEHAAVTVEHIRRWAEGGSAWTAIAVLTRVNSALLPVQVSLMEAGIPCMTPLGPKILTRTGMRSALAYLRIGVDPSRISSYDVTETIRRPSRRIARNVAEMLQKRPLTSIADIRRLGAALTGADAERVRSYAEDLQTVADAVRTGNTARALHAIRVDVGLGGAMDVLDDSRREADRSTHTDDLAALEQVASLHPDAATFEPWLGAVLARPGDADGVTLSTVHRVKGQEWPHVLVFGADDGSFPHRLATGVEEERRVFHVAITRASAEAVVVTDTVDPSPFCAELTGVAPRRSTVKGRRPVAKAGDGSRGSATGATGGAGSSGSPTKRAPLPLTYNADLGLPIRVRGGIDAEIVEIAERGVVVAPIGGSTRMLVEWSAEVEVYGRAVRLIRPGSPTPQEALASLRVWRKETAARDSVPAYVVFSDEYLEGLAAALPSTLAELARCRGVGPAKLDKYGDEILIVLESAAAASEQHGPGRRVVTRDSTDEK
ncbi:MAG: ATP-dependent DNA helicase UvrD2 [Acidimicrobiales bacterium]